jgi:excisionase family DNA binding protein
VLLGGERRKRPRPGVQRDHAFAVVRLASFLEQHFTGMTVLSERELRRRDRETPGRYRVDIYGPRNERARWPDLVAESATARVAVEVEFAPKASDRLRRILAGYRCSLYDQVRYVVNSPAMARRLSDLADREGMGLWPHEPAVTRLVILSWPWLTQDRAAAVVRSTSAIYRHDYVPVRSRQPASPLTEASSAPTDAEPQVRLDQPLLTAAQVAELLAVPVSSVYEYARRSRDPLPSIHIGRHRRFHRDTLADWLSRQLTSRP